MSVDLTLRFNSDSGLGPPISASCMGMGSGLKGFGPFELAVAAASMKGPTWKGPQGWSLIPKPLGV